MMRKSPLGIGRAALGNSADEKKKRRGPATGTEEIRSGMWTAVTTRLQRVQD